MSCRLPLRTTLGSTAAVRSFTLFLGHNLIYRRSMDGDERL